MTYDVAVIGYGPTGVTAANLLGAAGLSVVVVERDRSIYSRARAISTDEEVVRIWQQTGLAEEVTRNVLADRSLQFVDDRGRPFIRADVPARGHGYPPQMFIYQPALEETLRDGAARYPNVEVRLGQECLAVRQHDDHVELAVAGPDERIVRLRASYVIAADGGSSPTRGQLGVGFDGRTYEERWVVIDTEMIREWPEHDRLRFHCDPRRPAVDCPTPLGHHRWEFPVLPGEVDADLVTDAAVWRLLNRQGVTDEQVRILRAVGYSHHVRFASRWRIGRVFLAGDAAHVMPPWIGQGMSSGVRDAGNLCWKLAAVLSGALPESVLDSYEAERQPHVRAVTRRAVLAGWVITERRSWVPVLRDPLLRLITRFRRPHHALMDAVWVPICRYRNGFLAPGRSAAVGYKIPQPWVLDGAGARRRLDDVLGTGWTLLRLGSRGSEQVWSAVGAGKFDVLPSGSSARAGAVVDADGVLIQWMRRHRADRVVLRPDRIVYAAAGRADPLAPPPSGMARPAVQSEFEVAQEAAS